MKQSESIANLAAALVKASGEMQPVAKDRVNPHFKNKYATLDAITEAVRPVLAKHGLAIVQGSTVPETNEGVLVGFALETMLIHSSGEWLANSVVMPVEKASAQGAGSAISYGRRYGLSALLGLTSDEDDDGETATNHAPRAAYTAPRPTPSARPSVAPSSSTPNATASNGGAVMPFGKTKGTPLSQLKDAEIESALAWAREKGKFEEFQRDAGAELARRAGDVPEPVYAGSDGDDDLPF